MTDSPRLFSRSPGCDDTLRRLADVLQIPLTCRKRTCRRTGLCQGGYGPPCFLEQRFEFTQGVHEQMQEYREFWKAQRENMVAHLRGRQAGALYGEADTGWPNKAAQSGLCRFHDSEIDSDD
jgi:hypothetical protein